MTSACFHATPPDSRSTDRLERLPWRRSAPAVRQWVFVPAAVGDLGVGEEPLLHALAEAGERLLDALTAPTTSTPIPLTGIAPPKERSSGNRGVENQAAP
jgi:hypothetical protein